MAADLRECDSELGRDGCGSFCAAFFRMACGLVAIESSLALIRVGIALIISPIALGIMFYTGDYSSWPGSESLCSQPDEVAFRTGKG